MRVSMRAIMRRNPARSAVRAGGQWRQVGLGVQKEWLKMGFRKSLGFLTGVKTWEMCGSMEDGTEADNSGDS